MERPTMLGEGCRLRREAQKKGSDTREEKLVNISESVLDS